MATAAPVVATAFRDSAVATAFRDGAGVNGPVLVPRYAIDAAVTRCASVPAGRPTRRGPP